MPDNADNRPFQEIVRVLEEAVRAGVTSIGLEYKGRAVIAELVKRAACPASPGAR
jgi:hypothetical protein